jgi:hypothetical protein
MKSFVTFFFPVALQSLKDLGRLTYRFLDLFRHMVGRLGRVISPSQGLYLHRARQHRKTWANIHALSGIRTHDPSNQPAKTHASDRTATVTGFVIFKSVTITFVLVHTDVTERKILILFNVTLSIILNCESSVCGCFDVSSIVYAMNTILWCK